jgi:hypothetical protein
MRITMMQTDFNFCKLFKRHDLSKVASSNEQASNFCASHRSAACIHLTCIAGWSDHIYVFVCVGFHKQPIQTARAQLMGFQAETSYTLGTQLVAISSGTCTYVHGTPIRLIRMDGGLPRTARIAA